MSKDLFEKSYQKSVYKLCIFNMYVWCGPKVGTQKENTEYDLEVRKIYLQKLQRIIV